MILGIDEVGRGPWAGPLVVGAVVLDDHACGIEGLADSKKLTPKRREQLEPLIKEKALGWGLGWVHADEIDVVGLSVALRLATVRAVGQIKVPYHDIIIDGTINFLADTNKGAYVKTLPKADALIPSVSAAAIIAKVARDSFMAEQDAVYPGYSFGKHVGYGTALHRRSLEELGVTPLHRASFAPIKKLLGTAVVVVPVKPSPITTKIMGEKAESLVAEYLTGMGHTVVARNWKMKDCEIDIVSRFNGTLYFTEVKFRSSQQQGGGIEAVNGAKLARMKYAAERYVAQNKLHTSDMQLVVAAVDNLDAITFLEVS